MEYLVAIHAKTFAFLYRNDDFGQDGLVAMRTYGLHQGITLVDTEPFAATDTDLSVQVARARIKNPDAMVIWSTPPTASIAAKNIRQLGIRSPSSRATGSPTAPSSSSPARPPRAWCSRREAPGRR